TRYLISDQHSYCLNVEDDPKMFDEAMKSQDVAFWKEAINDDMDSIMGNNTWVLADIPLGCKPLGCKWIFKRKLKVDGTVEKFKARYTSNPGTQHWQAIQCNAEDNSSRSGWVFLLGGGVISWASKKQTCITCSTMKYELVALAVAGENISQKDLNLKFLRSLPSEWNTQVVVWRNKPDLDTMSFDDLYNNFKNVEQEKNGRKITINGSNTVGYDKSKVECFNCYKLRHFARKCRQPMNQDSRNRNQDSSKTTVNVEETASNAMVAIDGVVFDWSNMVDDEVSTNMALMEEFQQPEFEGYGPKTSNSVSEDISNEVKESLATSLVKGWC
nr:zinc finger, CCHC-type [Tanacetum cinerariifolium]